MISALALFNALLLGYSRIPFRASRSDGLLPKALAKLDAHGGTASSCYRFQRFFIHSSLLFRSAN